MGIATAIVAGMIGALAVQTGLAERARNEPRPLPPGRAIRDVVIEVAFCILEFRIQDMALRPQDVLVALKLAFGGHDASYAQLAQELDLSPSQVHAAVRRATEAGLVHAETRAVNARALAEFLIHGLKYVFPARRGAIARGMPTAHSAAPLRDLLVDGGEPLVWPDPEGEVRGETLLPIHKSAPGAARRDQRLYESLALLDAVRAGRARERKVAGKRLKEMLLGDA